MSITRVGSTKKFAVGWDGIFTSKKASAKGKKSASSKSTAQKASGKSGRKATAKKKPAKIVAPTAPGVLKKKAKQRPTGGKTGGPGDEKAKKSAAKRTSKTRTKRAAPELHQMELF
jgi:hypothetical protein